MLPLHNTYSSSSLIELHRHFRLGVSPCRRPYFLLSEEKVGKETDTGMLSNPNNSLIFNEPFQMCKGHAELSPLITLCCRINRSMH